ncbi:hypothetical protein TBLA_0F01420 [Henningerozyma blattae CBS 6284]|uniref:Ubiquitin-related modifier 1 n=1 Tax=Henningerozyma blattae (strain ATCC 34711 / CBS 6284 / DSM 70876 / NBRC 10599 / NRRL Y-10934 / UCD 77-7) TaxID=1071380 RepID=I2H5N3_HENB6|nr:hypothetical protein TBLA_0F01420 [Tetrapisispora blattae CBS 6284]CCH61685.1 hypothetical protein TBLA_0F01420 [Tetrapisispora blattae CBS 6284]
MALNITVEFLGGLDVTFNKQRVWQLSVPIPQDKGQVTMEDLINYIVNTMIADKNSVGDFVEDGTVRPGILTLINDTDWELEGEGAYVLEKGDVISFTSTLHGG